MQSAALRNDEEWVIPRKGETNKKSGRTKTSEKSAKVKQMKERYFSEGVYKALTEKVTKKIVAGLVALNYTATRV